MDLIHSSASFTSDSSARVTATTAKRESGRFRIDYLDGLRGIAALYVAFTHAFEMFGYGLADMGVKSDGRLGSSRGDSFVKLLADTVFNYGHAAVIVFIVLSGYSLMLPVARSATFQMPGGLKGYAWRRLRRIGPPYYAALAISLLLIAIVPGMNTRSGLYQDLTLPAFRPDVLVSHLFLFFNWGPTLGEKINPPMWSIGVEVQLYILLPLILLPLWRRFGIGAPVAFALAIGILTQYYPWENFDNAFFRYLVIFALGMFAVSINFANRPACIRLRRAVPWQWLGFAFFLLYLPVALAERAHFLGNVWNPYFYKDLVVGLATACMVIHFTELKKRQAPLARLSFLRLLSTKPVTELGKFSYSLYLMHAPVLMVMTLIAVQLDLFSVPAYLILVCAGIPAAVFFSYLFHLAFERRFMSGVSSKPAVAAAPEPAVAANQ